MSLALALVLSAAIAPPAAPAAVRAPSSLYGTTVAGVSLRGDAPVDEARLVTLSGLAPGLTLTETAVRRALRLLFLTGKFSDLWVEGTPTESGTWVTVRYYAAARLATVTLAGTGLPQRGRLRDALLLEPGDPWSPQEGRDAQARILRVLRARGYLDAAVTTEVEPGPTETSVALTVHVDPGAVAGPAPPAFTGDLAPLTAETLSRKGKLPGRKDFREVIARSDAERYAAAYHDLGYARAEVRYEGMDYDAARRLVTARYSVFVGPKVVLTVIGEKESFVRNDPQSPWSRSEPPDEDSVRRFARQLETSLQEKGFARAKVEVGFESVPGEDRITFRIERGERWVVRRVSFEGNRAISRRTLAGVVGTSPRGLLSTGRLVGEQLRKDSEAIAALYRSRGFADAKVGGAEVRETGVPFELEAVFRIDEGVAESVASVTVTGLPPPPEGPAPPRLAVTKGGPFRRADVDSDVGLLQSLLAERGYVEAQVDARTEPGPPGPGGGRTVSVAYDVRPGTPVFFGQVVTRGLRRTLPPYVERDYAFRPGEPFSFSKLIRTQQSLSRLGVFSRIDVTQLPTDPETSRRTVVVSLVEGKPWSVTYGVGAEYDRQAHPAFNPRFSLGASYANVFGRAILGSLDARYSRRETRVVASLRGRPFLGWDVPMAFTLYTAEEIRETYSVKRGGAFLELQKAISETVKGALRYQYEIVEPTAPDDILSTLERQNQRIFISSLSPTVAWDRRDDPITPHAGTFVAADLKWAFPLLAADAAFLKGYLQANLYRPYRRTTFALGFRLGAIEPFSTCSVPGSSVCPPNLAVPIAERFFAGGRTTHRAFPLDNLGIEGETLQDGAGIGGNGLVVGNAEWRVPLVGDLGVTFFLDVGNVWAGWRDVNVSQLRWGAGLGLFYATPVGPLRVEYGLKLDRKTGESPGELSLSIGYPF